MGCEYKKHNYSKIDIGWNNNGSNMSMGDLAKQGNKSIDGLMTKCVAVKRRGCK
jgi:hypothetical protein